jgi:thiol-disulfide isomerase/thioredoxin
LDRNEIVLVEHIATDYRRIELNRGVEMPDFTFEGIDKKKQTLYGLRGSYVLIYFWTPFCDVCRPDFPAMNEAYSYYHSRGFEIVGVYLSGVPDVDMKSLRAAFPVIPAGMVSGWVKQFYLRSYPTVLLLDKEGRIISRGQTGENEFALRGSGLLATLHKLIP